MRLDGAAHLIAITERPQVGTGRITTQHDPVKATNSHARLGELMAEARAGLPAADGSPPEPEGEGASGSPTPPGWFEDPTGRFAVRYWDGATWTDHVGHDGSLAFDPLAPAP